jgi:hypothetical protein
LEDSLHGRAVAWIWNQESRSRGSSKHIDDNFLSSSPLAVNAMFGIALEKKRGNVDDCDFAPLNQPR